MQSPIKPPARTLLIFARPESQQDDERQEGIIETSDGPQYFTVGDFLMRFVEWRTNRANALQDYLDELAEYQEQQADGTDDPGQKSPTFGSGTFPPCERTVFKPTAMSSSWSRQPRARSITGSR